MLRNLAILRFFITSKKSFNVALHNIFFYLFEIIFVRVFKFIAYGVYVVLNSLYLSFIAKRAKHQINTNSTYSGDLWFNFKITHYQSTDQSTKNAYKRIWTKNAPNSQESYKKYKKFKISDGIIKSWHLKSFFVWIIQNYFKFANFTLPCFASLRKISSEIRLKRLSKPEFTNSQKSRAGLILKGIK